MLNDIHHGDCPFEHTGVCKCPEGWPKLEIEILSNLGPMSEDVCEVCGAHVGFGVELLHLKRCDDHPRSKDT